jgi:hypothetical protein
MPINKTGMLFRLQVYGRYGAPDCYADDGKAKGSQKAKKQKASKKARGSKKAKVE